MVSLSSKHLMILGIIVQGYGRPHIEKYTEDIYKFVALQVQETGIMINQVLAGGSPSGPHRWPGSRGGALARFAGRPF